MGTYSWRTASFDDRGLDGLGGASGGVMGAGTGSLGGGGGGGWRREHHHRKHRKSRSWHPSPYVSDEDDDQLSREEKKQKIKVEIARRRQQIEENARLHEELLRLARLRESAELGFMPTPITEWYGYPSPHNYALSPSTQEGTSVLKSIDEILREEAGKRSSSLDYGRMGVDYGGGSYYSSSLHNQGTGGGSLHFDYNTYQSNSHTPLYRHHSVSRINAGGAGGGTTNRFGLTEEDRSMERIASTFRTDDYTTSVYERLSDFSPLATDSESLMDFTPAAMPLLPDMPTRSRKLLEDLGSSPITESVLSLPQKGGPQSRYGNKGGGSGGSGGGTAGGPSGAQSSGGGHEARGGGNPSAAGYPDNYGTLGGSSRKPLKTTFSLGGCGSSSSPGSGGGGGGGIGGSGGGGGGGGGGSSGGGSKQPKKSQASDLQHTEAKYNFPVKRLFLTRDPEDRSVGGNGLGMRIVGGKEIAGSTGLLGAFVTRIYPGGVVDTFGDININDQVLEWNGINLNNKTFEEVQQIISQTKGDIELVVLSCGSRLSLQSSSTPSKKFPTGSHVPVDGIFGGGPGFGGSKNTTIGTAAMIHTISNNNNKITTAATANKSIHAAAASNSPLLTSRSNQSSPRRGTKVLPPAHSKALRDVKLIGPSGSHSLSSSYDNLSSTTIDM